MLVFHDLHLGVQPQPPVRHHLLCHQDVLRGGRDEVARAAERQRHGLHRLRPRERLDLADERRRRRELRPLTRQRLLEFARLGVDAFLAHAGTPWCELPGAGNARMRRAQRSNACPMSDCAGTRSCSMA